ncbi:MAG TPA: hypothetical protein VE177_04530 [Candidatus Binatus sp.]|nr:hypothetical protein [Candidatus Binatus sp.]
MWDQASSGEYERVLKRVRKLQQAVLLHLKEVGPTNWNGLYRHFNQNSTAEVTHALRYLTRSNHITAESDNTAKITALGMEQLKSEK